MIQEYFLQIILTVVLILSLPVIKYVIRKLIKAYGQVHKKIESRTNQVIRIFFISLNLSLVISLIIIWGVDPRNLLLALSSIFAVIGVALFAQWSILSNITSGIIIFFSSPFRVGDYIHILDKDVPFDAHVEEIKSFHTLLRNKEGEYISYPNSLFFQKGVSIIHVDNWEDEMDE